MTFQQLILPQYSVYVLLFNIYTSLTLKIFLQTISSSDLTVQFLAKIGDILYVVFCLDGQGTFSFTAIKARF